MTIAIFLLSRLALGLAAVAAAILAGILVAAARCAAPLVWKAIKRPAIVTVRWSAVVALTTLVLLALGQGVGQTVGFWK